MISIKEIVTEAEYKPREVCDSVPLPQTWWYGEAQVKRGRQVKRFALFRDNEIKGYVQWIAYPLVSTLSYWYAPYGPVMASPDREILIALRDKFKSLEEDNGIVFIRFDFFPALSGEMTDTASKIFTRSSKTASSGSYYQPRYEWYTDIKESEDTIIMAMHQKTRYSVRLAEKKGVTTSVVSGKDLSSHLSSFLDLMKKTAKRNQFTLHDDFYYKTFFEEVAERGNGFLIEASLSGELLASHLVIVEGDVAHYVFGGTSDTKKEICAPFLAHFNGMKEAKLLGAKYYNFGGINEAGSAPHWEGVTAFKKRFGGHVVAHSEYFDVVIRPFWYHLYNFRKFIKRFI
ncbi:MAG: peptidoglycan bridge formation glycyltransferase FemA/FemB family protein [Candidatus Paceibacterota bacterium]|jgi:lipid II:glycine glycyltransferase (peptidoglycan interpeptide bridge formation enzyme)